MQRLTPKIRIRVIDPENNSANARRHRFTTGVFCLLYLSIIHLFVSCKNNNDTLFRLHSPDETQVSFVNRLTPNDSINPFTFTNFYNGGGVGIGDVNRDGKPDIFFGGNQVSSKLYLSRIDTISQKWAFEDITEQAGVTTSRWCSGISMVDINQDGLLDIYISVASHVKMQDSENLLFVNQGNGADGVPTFKELAKAYRLNTRAFTTQTAFFDADLDGDLDAYMMNTAPDLQNPNFIRKTYHDGSYPSTGRFYLNEGWQTNGLPRYTDISKDAGVKYEGLGLGLAVSDMNKDGYPDIYCSNDFISSDMLYLNAGKGAQPLFSNVIKEATAHTSLFGMGVDIADINNDTYPDIFQLDMLPEDNLRQKKMLAGQDYDRKEMSISDQYGYQLQYMRNMLQLNLGPLHEKNGNAPVTPRFAEIGLLAGISKTDWSWAPLIADYDNDGLKDIFITNGYRRDVTDRDFIQFKEDFSNFGTNDFKQQNALELIQKVPEVKIRNYAYKNAGSLTFQNTSKEWGLDELSYSNGAAYADLDGDGDLDLVVNNIDSEPLIYQNQSREKARGNFLSVTFKGDKGNLDGIGCNVTIWQGKQAQYAEMYVARGFISSVGSGLHFGLGNSGLVDSLLVTWPGGMTQKLYKVAANQHLEFRRKDARNMLPTAPKAPEPFFRDVTEDLKIDFVHKKSGYIDFKQTAALHKMLSKSGFAIAVGDANQDGLDDFFAGASYLNGKPCIYFQQASGTFAKREIAQDSLHENIAATFFDADGDQDQDLVVVNGGSERPVSDQAFYHVQLYLNDGRGNFKLAPAGNFPAISLSGSCVVAHDFDKDGDADLFIGGRMVPGKYPLPARSYLLRNDSHHGKPAFTDITASHCPGLLSAGMVCAAIWADADNDGLDDLVIAGEWMPVRIFKNQQTKFLETESIQTSLSPYSGWWNSLAAGDFDHDGDVDFIAGNEGINTFYRASEREPVTLVAKDFNNDGTFDPLMGYFIQGVSYPSVPRDALNQQVIQFRRKYPHYIDYAKATFDDLLSADEKKGAYAVKAAFLQTAYMENQGNGHFAVKALPIEAQMAPVFGIVVTDVNADHNPDVILSGNFYPNEVNMGRQDASTGLLLLGNGKGAFAPQSPAKSGLLLQGDARSSRLLRGPKNQHLLLTAMHSKGVTVHRISTALYKQE
ncbi:VCBS repeat-containing protein [Dyadobacter fermentans]|uniref:VCBS repeat-containing protein n=1 Tax=Dyadobacter fermentans TaxID=94254 RepID=UPI001CBEA06B|nr:VCBS repeat-containing protein [Dyadobacter fermentans]MBZ1357818.1 VCBS repeat-containing protein [Dyadobacter fermentans]